jgi:hypothetical protein
LDDYNKVAVNLEFNKLLVPTPQNPDLENGTITPEERRQNLDNYRSIGWVSVYLNHLEMRQAVLAKKVKKYAVGAEYSYQDSFAMRMGYFHESPLKEIPFLRAGFKYNVEVDVSHLFSASKEKTLEYTCFSFTFNFMTNMMYISLV